MARTPHGLDARALPVIKRPHGRARPAPVTGDAAGARAHWSNGTPGVRPDTAATEAPRRRPYATGVPVAPASAGVRRRRHAAPAGHDEGGFAYAAAHSVGGRRVPRTDGPSDGGTVAAAGRRRSRALAARRRTPGRDAPWPSRATAPIRPQTPRRPTGRRGRCRPATRGPGAGRRSGSRGRDHARRHRLGNDPRPRGDRHLAHGAGGQRPRRLVPLADPRLGPVRPRRAGAHGGRRPVGRPRPAHRTPGLRQRGNWPRRRTVRRRPPVAPAARATASPVDARAPARGGARAAQLKP